MPRLQRSTFFRSSRLAVLLLEVRFNGSTALQFKSLVSDYTSVVEPLNPTPLSFVWRIPIGSGKDAAE
jgi:hypothetical protein